MFSEETDWLLPDARRRAGRSCSSRAPRSCTSAARRRSATGGGCSREQVRGHLRFVAQAPGPGRPSGAAAAARARCSCVSLALRGLSAFRGERRARATGRRRAGLSCAAADRAGYLRLAGATLLLLAPGALLARSASGALVASLGLLFAAMVVVFATGSSITLALWLLVARGRRRAPVRSARGRPTARPLLARGARRRRARRAPALARAPDPSGDALFHLARVRKLWALDDLSLNAVDEFATAGCTPATRSRSGTPSSRSSRRSRASTRRDVVAARGERAHAARVPRRVRGGRASCSARAGSASRRSPAQLGLIAFASGSGGALRAARAPGDGGRPLTARAGDDRARLRVPASARREVGSCWSPRRGSCSPSFTRRTRCSSLLVLGGYRGRAPARRAGGAARARDRGRRARRSAAIVFLAWLFPTVQGTASFTPVGRAGAVEAARVRPLSGPVHREVGRAAST